MRKLNIEILKERYFFKYPENIGRIEILGEYIDNRTPLLVKVEHGFCLSAPSHLMNGRFPTIKSAVDKHAFFLSVLNKNNRYFREGYFEVLGKYVSDRERILLRTKYGELLGLPNKLINRGDKPTVMSAVNQRDYWVNMVKEKHNNFYSYENVLEYNKNPSNITCPIHGGFNQHPQKHLSGDGCPKCGVEKISKARKKDPTGWTLTRWKEQAKKSKKFDSFKLYIIRCWNDEEEFYKIGRTFMKLKHRFHAFSTLPYNYEVQDIIEKTAKGVFNLEKRLKSKNKKNKYTPKIKFNGMHECFNKIK